jgi:hypothetical protein
MLPIESFWGFVTGLITYGGGATAISYFIFQFMGKSWLENKFAKELEEFRHEKTKEIEKLKIEIQSLLSGKLKLQDRDFNVLPEAWNMLNQAQKKLASTVSPYQQYPDLKTLNRSDLNVFLREQDLANITKRRIRTASDPSKEYVDAITWKRISDVRNAIADFKDYVDKHSILMEPDLKTKFGGIAQQMWSSIITKEVGHQSKDWKMQSEAWKELEEKVKPEINEIEGLINVRLSSYSK